MAPSRPATDYNPLRPWERQPFDTDHGWALFSDYVAMGPTRSLPTLLRRHPQANGYAVRNLAKDDGWAVRAEAWDRYIERERRYAIEDMVKDDARTTAERHGTILKGVSALIERNLIKMLKAEGQSEDFPTLTGHVFARLLKEAITLERLHSGDATERIEGPDLSGLSVEDLRQLRALGAKAGVND